MRPCGGPQSRWGAGSNDPRGCWPGPGSAKPSKGPVQEHGANWVKKNHRLSGNFWGEGGVAISGTQGMARGVPVQATPIATAVNIFTAIINVFVTILNQKYINRVFPRYCCGDGLGLRTHLKQNMEKY